MIKTLKFIFCFTLMIASSLTLAQSRDFTIESDYIETIDGQTINIVSTLRKDGNNLIWTKDDGQKQRMVFFAILNSNENEQDSISENSVLTYYLEANGLEGELIIKTVNTEAEPSYKVNMKTASFLGNTEDFSFHLINFTLK